MVKDLIQYFVDVRVELSKIVWPSFNELVGSVIIVLLLVTFFAIYIGLIDVILYNIAGRIF
jgi:preprotein translocase subunit SecE